MIRRNQRMRREYLYTKSLEGAERAQFEKKRRIRQALEEGKPIPTELRNEEHELRRQIDLEDQERQVPKSFVDNEYATGTIREPKILLTTSRDPSAPLIQFVKVLSEIVESCQSHDITDLILVHEHRGQPDGLVISHLPQGPTAYFGLLNVVTRHDIKDRKAMGKMSEAYPHLVLDNFSTTIGERTATILKHLFPVPKPDSKRIITFANRDDYISFRHHVYEKPGGPKSIDLKEVGPRFEMRLYKLKLGTMEQNEARCEFELRPYINTAKKQKTLGA
ncbi:U3 small nucleolar ribonucleoprotein IMP4 [Panicum miliaceum]|uniref:U3 small nucleolar ribonucleoprotein IMP4 n=1 Tax=Panicum miliaceum TaxID=4540 RepID=A0A3L6PNT7_PANMI|nr:U3 small nucleolar ribonucleoprotein IMP4 [Panicum miliaceum]